MSNSMMALQEAMNNGYDEALLLDANGFVMEGSGENVFIVKDGKLHTPDLTSALDGITRKTIMTIAAATTAAIPTVIKSPMSRSRNLSTRANGIQR